MNRDKIIKKSLLKLSLKPDAVAFGELLQLLKKIESDPDIKDVGNLKEKEHKKMIKEIEDLATQVLINNGKPNFNTIDVLKNKGFKVVPGETDSFGWLTAIIETKKGDILFG